MPTSSTINDVSSLVDGANEELDCLCAGCDLAGPCGGSRTAYYTSHLNHPCEDGWLCDNHFKFYVNVYRPTVVEKISGGPVQCTHCGWVCHTADEFCKVMAL